VNLLAAMVISRVDEVDIDEVDNAVMMSPAVFLIAATVIRWALSAHLRRMTDPSPQVLIRDGVINAATLRSRFLTRGEIRARLHARGHPRFELIRLAPSTWTARSP
jgi:uncharacterized membrane protein YcaP (DUF421 family)